MNRTTSTTTGALLLALIISGVPALADTNDQNERDRRQERTARARPDNGGSSQRPAASADRESGRQARDSSAPQERRDIAVPRATARVESNTRNEDRQAASRQSDRRQSAAPQYTAPQNSAPTYDRRQTVAPPYNAPRDNARQDNARTNTRNRTVAPGYDTRQYDARQYDRRQYDNRRYDTRGYNTRGYNTRGYSSRGYDTGRYSSWGYSYFPYISRSRVRFGLGISIFAGRPYDFRFDYGWAPPYAYRFSLRSGIGYGGMSFLVDPDDAAIYVDGEFIGIASDFDGQPVPLAPGIHEIELQAEDCEPVVFDVTVRPGQVIPYRGSLMDIR